MNEAIAQQIAQDLSASPYQPLRELKVTTQNGAIVLSGTTPTFYYRQLAQKCAKDYLPSTIELIDLIEIVSDS